MHSAPEEVVEAAIAGGIELLGITDHNYGIGNQRMDILFSTAPEIKNEYERTLVRYFDHINLIKEKYAGKIKILRGIEVGTVIQNRVPLPDSADISFFDYCLIEHTRRRGVLHLKFQFMELFNRGAHPRPPCLKGAGTA